MATLCSVCRNGVYPLTAFNSVSPLASQGNRARAATPEQVESVKLETPEPVEAEGRMVIRHSCQIHRVDNTPSLQVSSKLRDNMLTPKVSIRLRDSWSIKYTESKFK